MAAPLSMPLRIIIAASSRTEFVQAAAGADVVEMKFPDRFAAAAEG